MIKQLEKLIADRHYNSDPVIKKIVEILKAQDKQITALKRSQITSRWGLEDSDD